MLTSDVFRVGMIVNVFWMCVALFLNNRWYKYTVKLNELWADICDTLCNEIEDKKGEVCILLKSDKGEENNGQST